MGWEKEPSQVLSSKLLMERESTIKVKKQRPYYLYLMLILVLITEGITQETNNNSRWNTRHW